PREVDGRRLRRGDDGRVERHRHRHRDGARLRLRDGRRIGQLHRRQLAGGDVLGWWTVHDAVALTIVTFCGPEIVRLKTRSPDGGFAFVLIVIAPSRLPAGTVAVPVPPL